MRIILSRKGFDSASGGGPSPVLEDGTMLSLPIPENGGDGHAPENLAEANWHRYDDLILRPEIKEYCKNQSKSNFCHLDPDIRPKLWQKQPDNWQAAFGQCGAAGKHLKNNLDLTNIKQENILFLFFGLFRHWENNKFTGKPFHAIWGYMVCDEVITNTGKMKEFQYHPHAKLERTNNEFNNLLFIAKDGYCGTFQFCEKLVLTVQKHSPSHWKLDCLPWLDVKTKQSHMTYHDNPERFQEKYFQSACRGQEFVVTSQANKKPELNWENCSFCQILSNLEKMYQKKGKNL